MTVMVHQEILNKRKCDHGPYKYFDFTALLFVKQFKKSRDKQQKYAKSLFVIAELHKTPVFRLILVEIRM